MVPRNYCDSTLMVDRLAAIYEKISIFARDPSAVTVIAVTKGFGNDVVQAAVQAGMFDLGENYADELVAKARAWAGEDPAPKWHFLGSVQRNKVPRLAPLVQCWQSVCRLEEGRAIAQRRPGSSVLVQVDIAEIPDRGGCNPDVVAELVSALRLEDLDVAGLMAVGRPGPPEASRSGFHMVASMADRLELPVRSMGMTDDLEIALAEGSTMVRIGRGIFGDRPPKD